MQRLPVYSTESSFCESFTTLSFSQESPDKMPPDPHVLQIFQYHTIFQQDQPAAIACHLRIMCDHNNRLSHMFINILQCINHNLPGLGIEVSVGSSARIRSGLLISARQIVNSLFSPPDTSYGCFSKKV